MAEEGLLYGERTWFYDPRSPVRRMAVANHPEHGLVVLSLWTGDTCTATFRLPMADAARLISVMADGLAGSISAAPPAGVTPAPRGWRALVARVRRRVRPVAPVAPVVPLRSVQ